MAGRGAVDAGEVRSWLEARAEEMAELVEWLVAIDSENPPGPTARDANAPFRRTNNYPVLGG